MSSAGGSAQDLQDVTQLSLDPVEARVDPLEPVTHSVESALDRREASVARPTPTDENLWTTRERKRCR